MFGNWESGKSTLLSLVDEKIKEKVENQKLYCYPICKEAYERNIIEDSVVIGYLPWEEILAVLENEVVSEELTKYEKLIIQDLIELLKRKGLEKFRSFDIECPNIDSDLYYEFEGKEIIDIDFTFNHRVVT